MWLVIASKPYRRERRTFPSFHLQSAGWRNRRKKKGEEKYIEMEEKKIENNFLSLMLNARTTVFKRQMESIERIMIDG